MHSRLFFPAFVALAAMILLAGSPAQPTHDPMTIAFYNVENLFDTTDNAEVMDEEFTPGSRREWNTNKYETKVNNLSRVIGSIATHGPDVLGLAEIENLGVLEDLSSRIDSSNYSIIHKNSPDGRGIDVAMLYKSARFKTSVYEYLEVVIPNDRPTRDILHVQFTTHEDETIHVYVNHWPSRWGGKDTSEPKRIIAAKVLRSSIDKALTKDANAQVIVMGDFNDEPMDKSISETLGANSNPNNRPLYNPFYALREMGAGSYCYRGKWDMLDQIMVSQGLRDKSGWDYLPHSQYIFDRPWLRQENSDYAGYPLRSFGGPHYLAGYSDHLPVFIQLYYNAQ